MSLIRIEISSIRHIVKVTELDDPLCLIDEPDAPLA